MGIVDKLHNEIQELKHDKKVLYWFNWFFVTTNFITIIALGYVLFVR